MLTTSLFSSQEKARIICELRAANQDEMPVAAREIVFPFVSQIMEPLPHISAYGFLLPDKDNLNICPFYLLGEVIRERYIDLRQKRCRVMENEEEELRNRYDMMCYWLYKVVPVVIENMHKEIPKESLLEVMRTFVNFSQALVVEQRITKKIPRLAQRIFRKVGKVHGLTVRERKKLMHAFFLLRDLDLADMAMYAYENWAKS